MRRTVESIDALHQELARGEECGDDPSGYWHVGIFVSKIRRHWWSRPRWCVKVGERWAVLIEPHIQRRLKRPAADQRRRVGGYGRVQLH